LKTPLTNYKPHSKTQHHKRNKKLKNINEIHYEILSRNINVLEKGIKSGVPSGFRLLDNVTNGWQPSDLIILAGRPSMGKTAAAISMIIHPAIEEKKPVAIFSLEMSNFQIGSRIQSYISGVNVSKIVKGQVNMDEIRQITSTCVSLEKSPLFIDDTPNISLIELKSKARKLVKDNGVQLIVIDYLQLMRSGMDVQNREQEIAEISKGLKSLAKELNIPVIALSQLSRGVESRSDKKPMLSDLRESGQIEQDADMVIFCFRPEYYGIDTYEIGTEVFQSFGLMMLIIAKHRNGELGEIPLKFVHEQAKIENMYIHNNNNTNNFDNSNNSNTFVPTSSGVKLLDNNDFLNQKNDETAF
jgi:replicative DNA helicase